MRGMRHPLTDVVYELDDEGNIRLTDGDRIGTFDRHGDGWPAIGSSPTPSCACGWAPVRGSRST
jgi:hypothetical protein